MDNERCANCANVVTAHDLGYRGPDVWDYCFCGALSDRDFMTKHGLDGKNQIAPPWCPRRHEETESRLKGRIMKTYTQKQLDRFSSAGYTVKHLTKNIVLIRRYSVNAHRWIARLPIYGLYRVQRQKADKDRMMNGIALWCSFYRANPHRFCEDYLNIKLHFFQQLLIVMMNIHICDKCKYYHPYYGNKNKSGKRVVSNHWCSRRNRFVKRSPKQCALWEPNK